MEQTQTIIKQTATIIATYKKFLGTNITFKKNTVFLQYVLTGALSPSFFLPYLALQHLKKTFLDL